MFQGALAGVIATVPMSISMQAGWMLLPTREKYPLPPRLITERVAERVGIEDDLSEAQLVTVSILSHFGYGAVTGAIYALFEQKIPLRREAKGIIAGLLVWILSYLGWIPAMGILRPATQHPRHRNIVMILAHLVWGLALGKSMRWLAAGD